MRKEPLFDFEGAGYVVPFAGDTKMMPGADFESVFCKIDVDVKTGKVRGLF
jgi:formyltetrahydrofolate synthetase